MADNTLLNIGVGGDTVRLKDRGGVKTQIIAVDLNPSGAEALMSGSMPINDNAGSITIDGTITASGTTGNVAHDGVDFGNPLKIGYKAISVGSSPTAVAAGDRTDAYANLHGIPFVQPGHPNTVTVKANFTTAQTDTALITVATGNKIIVLRSRVAAANANTVDVSFTIGFGATNTPTTTGVIHSHPGLPSGLHDSEGNGGGMLGIGADDQDLRITSSVPTGGSIDVNITYYLLPS